MQLLVEHRYLHLYSIKQAKQEDTYRQRRSICLYVCLL